MSIATAVRFTVAPEMAIWSLPASTLAGGVKLVVAALDELEPAKTLLDDELELLERLEELSELLELLATTELDAIELEVAELVVAELTADDLELDELEAGLMLVAVLDVVGLTGGVLPPPPPQALKLMARAVKSPS